MLHVAIGVQRPPCNVRHATDTLLPHCATCHAAQRSVHDGASHCILKPKPPKGALRLRSDPQYVSSLLGRYFQPRVHDYDTYRSGRDAIACNLNCCILHVP